MRILLDENIPHGLRALLTGHDTFTVAYLGWAGVKNGQLLKAAEDAGFEILITSDQGIPYQQNIVGRKLTMIMLSTADWNVLKFSGSKIVEAISASSPGSFTRVDCGAFSRRRPKGPTPSP
jgi:hypothetical protein